MNRELEYILDNYHTFTQKDQEKERIALAQNNQLMDVLSYSTGVRSRAALRVLADFGVQIASFIKENLIQVESLLLSDDPKVRINAAEIIGNCCAKDSLDALIVALEKEQTMYAIPALIQAVGRADHEDAWQFLDNYQPVSTVEKHLLEEKKALATALARYKKQERTNVRVLSSDIIMMSSMHPQTTANELTATGLQVQRAGDYVAVSGFAKYNDIFKIRAFEKAYIYLGKCNKEELASLLSSRQEAIFQRTGVRSYRLEIANISHQEQTQLIQEIRTKMDKLNYQPSGHHSEILADVQTDGSVWVLLDPMADHRFDYRKRTTSISIRPALAATICAYARQHLSASARVLDNYCDCGTLLFERGCYAHHSLTGIDEDQYAIQAAEYNSRSLKINPQFHQIDALRFTSKKYNEVITNLKPGLKLGSLGQNKKAFIQYTQLLPNILLENGIAILFVQDVDLLNQTVEKSRKLEIIEHTTMERAAIDGLVPGVCIVRKKSLM